MRQAQITRPRSDIAVYDAGMAETLRREGYRVELRDRAGRYLATLEPYTAAYVAYLDDPSFVTDPRR